MGTNTGVYMGELETRSRVLLKRQVNDFELATGGLHVVDIVFDEFNKYLMFPLKRI